MNQSLIWSFALRRGCRGRLAWYFVEAGSERAADAAAAQAAASTGWRLYAGPLRELECDCLPRPYGAHGGLNFVHAGCGRMVRRFALGAPAGYRPWRDPIETPYGTARFALL